MSMLTCPSIYSQAHIILAGGKLHSEKICQFPLQLKTIYDDRNLPKKLASQSKNRILPPEFIFLSDYIFYAHLFFSLPESKGVSGCVWSNIAIVHSPKTQPTSLTNAHQKETLQLVSLCRLLARRTRWWVCFLKNHLSPLSPSIHKLSQF